MLVNSQLVKGTKKDKNAEGDDKNAGGEDKNAEGGGKDRKSVV